MNSSMPILPADWQRLPRTKKLALAHRLSRLETTNQSADFTEWKDDPVGFVREVLGADPWERQCEILEAMAREPRVTVRSCNGAGKTLCAAWVVLWFLQTRPGSIVVTTAPTGRQVRDYLWRRIRNAFAEARTPLIGRCLTTVLECGTEWYAIGFSTDQEVNFQGPHSPHGVLFVADEASGLAEWTFDAMSGSLTEPGAKQLLIGNPNFAAGTFYDSHNTWAPSQKFHISAFDVPEHVLRPDWKDEILAGEHGDESSPVYQVRVLGEFPEQGEDSLISRRWVVAAQERDDHAQEGDRWIGVDVARYGGDESVAYVQQAGVVVGADYWRGNDTMASAGRVAAFYQRVGGSRIHVDEIGVGAGVLDRLRELKLPAVGVNVGESARDSEKFANKRAEIFWGLRQRFQDGDISIPKEDTELFKQLVSLRFSYTSRGQIKLVSKEDLKKADMPSPDRADALALCFASNVGGWVPVSGRSRGRQGRGVPAWK